MLLKIYLCYGCSTRFMLGFNIYTPITIPAWFINCNYNKYFLKETFVHGTTRTELTLEDVIISSSKN